MALQINCQYKWSASGKRQWLTNSAVSVLEINDLFWTLNWWLLILSSAALNSQLCSSYWKHTAVIDYQFLFIWCQNGYLLFDHKHWPLSPQVNKDKLQSPTQLHSSRKNVCLGQLFSSNTQQLRTTAKNWLLSHSQRTMRRKREFLNHSFMPGNKSHKRSYSSISFKSTLMLCTFTKKTCFRNMCIYVVLFNCRLFKTLLCHMSCTSWKEKLSAFL